MEWTTVGLISYLVLWILVVVQAILTLALARLVGRLSRRFPPSGARVIDPGPEIGSAVEDWEGNDLLDRPFRVGFPRARGLLLLYLSPHCSSCAALIPSAKRFFKEVSGEVEGVWVMVVRNRETGVNYARENGLGQNAALAEDQLPASWRVAGAPFALWIDAAGIVITKGMVNHREHLESLWQAARAGHPSKESHLSAQAEAAEQGRG